MNIYDCLLPMLSARQKRKKVSIDRNHVASSVCLEVLEALKVVDAKTAADCGRSGILSLNLPIAFSPAQIACSSRFYPGIKYQ